MKSLSILAMEHTISAEGGMVVFSAATTRGAGGARNPLVLFKGLLDHGCPNIG